MKIKFRTFLSDTSSYTSETGTPYLQEYEYQIDKKGVERLVPSDHKRNVYEAIQADYDSTDINLLMLRFSLGETSALDKADPFYGDVTKMPTTMADLFNKAKECEQFFDELPADFKQMFNNSYMEFFSEFNSDEKSVFHKFDEYNDRFIDHDYDDFSNDSDVKAGDDSE